MNDSSGAHIHEQNRGQKTSAQQRPLLASARIGRRHAFENFKMIPMRDTRADRARLEGSSALYAALALIFGQRIVTNL
jgi:hypothetical protein